MEVFYDSALSITAVMLSLPLAVTLQRLAHVSWCSFCSILRFHAQSLVRMRLLDTTLKNAIRPALSDGQKLLRGADCRICRGYILD